MPARPAAAPSMALLRSGGKTAVTVDGPMRPPASLRASFSCSSPHLTKVAMALALSLGAKLSVVVRGWLIYEER